MALASAALLCGCMTPASFDHTRHAKVGAADGATIPLKTYFRGLRTVAIHTGGNDYTFLVDTAGGRTLISPRLAEQLSCTPRGREVGYRMTGEAVAFQQCPRFTATIAGLPIELTPVAVFDIGALLPRELPSLDGVLALDAFRGKIVGLDWAHDEIVVSTAHGAAARFATLPARIATGENGGALTVLVPVRSKNDTMWFLLDSGNIRGTLLGGHVIRDGFVDATSESKASLTVGGAAPELFDVIVDTINYDGVFGTDYLQTHAVALDLRAAH